MRLYPDVQKKAQDAIESLTGNLRLPDMDDQDNLPYITAVMKETLRWFPITTLGRWQLYLSQIISSTAITNMTKVFLMFRPKMIGTKDISSLQELSSTRIYGLGCSFIEFFQSIDRFLL
jgi:hypothetical protein